MEKKFSIFKQFWSHKGKIILIFRIFKKNEFGEIIWFKGKGGIGKKFNSQSRLINSKSIGISNQYIHNIFTTNHKY